MNRTTAAFFVAVSCVSPGALAQGVAGFDGTYTGISVTVQKFGSINCSPRSESPPTLTVSNGAARTPTSHGTVSPQGALLLHRDHGSIMQGQIDAQGNAMAKVVGTDCLFTYVWRKTGG